MSLFGFSGCRCTHNESADPAKDTVKFNVQNQDAGDKENVAPQVPKDDELAAAAAKKAQERERVEAEAKYQRELEEKRKRAEEQQRQLEEEARRQREVEEQREAERARAEEIRRAEEEAERRRLAQEAEEQRVRDEEEQREREREAQEAAEKTKKVEDFLARHGYSTVNTKRKTKFGRYKYPLHTAVKHDPEIVPFMLEAGADPANKDSKGKTPYEYAKQMKSPAEAALQAPIA